MNVYEKLQHVQSGLKAPKNQFNKFGNYHYRNCEDIQEAVKPLLGEVNAVLIVGDELVTNSDRHYIKATARFIDCESGEALENTAYAREELEKKGMDVSQVTGSASSYARKYALNGLFCIDDVKDMDNQDNSSSGTGNASKGKAGAKGKGKAPEGPASENDTGQEKITQPMVSSIMGLIEKYSSKGLKLDKILKMYKIKELAEMSVLQYKDCMEKLKLYEKGEQTNE